MSATPRFGEAFIPWKQKVAVGVLAIHFVGQLLFPFHHYLYPGDVNWTAEGSYFTWHMRMASKDVKGTLIATDPATGKTWDIDPKQHLHPRQTVSIFSDPDMTLQYAHFVAREAAAAGQGDIEIRARVQCALNRRKPRLIIDPEVNLVAQERSIRPASFIIPFDEAPLVEDLEEGKSARLAPDSGSSAAE